MKNLITGLLCLFLSSFAFAKSHKSITVSAGEMVAALDKTSQQQLPGRHKIVPVEVLAVSQTSISYKINQVFFHLEVVKEKEGLKLKLNDKSFSVAEVSSPEAALQNLIRKFKLNPKFQITSAQISERGVANVVDPTGGGFQEMFEPATQSGSSGQDNRSYQSFNFLPQQSDVRFSSLKALSSHLSEDNMKEALSISGSLLSAAMKFATGNDAFGAAMSLGVTSGLPERPNFSFSGQ